jgi:hypothetical protein
MNSINIFILAVCISYCSLFAQATMETDNIYNLSSTNFQLSPKLSTTSLPLVMHHEKQEKRLNIGGVVFGTLMMTAGTVLSLNGYYRGKDHYRRYKNSAFTDNTDKLRMYVKISNAKMIGGGIIAGTGLLVTVFSF